MDQGDNTSGQKRDEYVQGLNPEEDRRYWNDLLINMQTVLEYDNRTF